MIGGYVPRRTAHQLEQHDVRGASQNFEDAYNWEESDEVPLFLRSKSNVGRMAEASDFYSMRAIDQIKRFTTAQNPDFIDRDTLCHVVRCHRERFIGCLSLPFSMVFFLLFALAAYLHEDITNVYMVESGLREVFGVGLADIKDVAGLWAWVRFGQLTPKLFQQDDAYGRPEPNKTFWSRVLTYNQLQGPMVMELMRSLKEACNDGEGSIGKMQCYPQNSQDDSRFVGRTFTPQVEVPSRLEYNNSAAVTLSDRLAYYRKAFSPTTPSGGRRLRKMRQEYMPWLPGGSSSDGVYKAFIYPNTPYNKIQEHLNYMYQRKWLGLESKVLTVKALLLNAEVGRPRLEQLTIVYKFSRGGGIFTRLTLESLFLEMWDGMRSIAADVLFVICLTFITAGEVRGVWNAMRSGNCCKNLKRFWTILQWFIIFFGWCCVLGYLLQNTMRKAVVESLEDVIENQINDLPADFNRLGEDLHGRTDSMVYFTSWFRILIAEYHLVLMFRFFTAFHSQPRLGIVTSTLEASLIDIIHFLVVLLPTFMAYAISGCFIFGRRMEQFSTFDAAIGTCFKMAMEGEYNWDELSAEHYWTAAFWTWTFMLLLVLLMLNMVLAIVMDVYLEMRMRSGKSETVWATIKAILQRLWLWRRWVSPQELAAGLENMPQLLTKEQLLEAFPKLCEQQLSSLITACRHEIEMESTKDGDLKDSMKMQMAVKLAIDKVTADIAELQEEMQETPEDPYQAALGSNFDSSEKEDKGWLQETAETMAVQNHWMLSLQWQLQQLQWQWQVIEALRGHETSLGTAQWHTHEEDDVI